MGVSRVVKQKSALQQLLAHNEMNTILSSVIIGGIYASEKTASSFYFNAKKGRTWIPQNTIKPIHSEVRHGRMPLTFLMLCLFILFKPLYFR